MEGRKVETERRGAGSQTVEQKATREDDPSCQQCQKQSLKDNSCRRSLEITQQVGSLVAPPSEWKTPLKMLQNQKLLQKRTGFTGKKINK